MSERELMTLSSVYAAHHCERDRYGFTFGGSQKGKMFARWVGTGRNVFVPFLFCYQLQHQSGQNQQLALQQTKLKTKVALVDGLQLTQHCSVYLAQT